MNSDAVDKSRSPENPGELSVEELIARAIEDGSLACPVTDFVIRIP